MIRIAIVDDEKEQVVMLSTCVSVFFQERNLEYRKRAYEQFMDEVLSKEEYLELKQMYETENQKYQKELSAEFFAGEIDKQTLDNMNFYTISEYVKKFPEVKTEEKTEEIKDTTKPKTQKGN